MRSRRSFPSFSQIDLAKVNAYERKNQNRSTVTSSGTALQASEPWPGYDELAVDEIRAVLSEGDDTQIKSVRATSGARRASACGRPPSASSATPRNHSRKRRGPLRGPLLRRLRPVRRAGTIIKRTLVSFYDDQMTHHAAALTYYALMSLFPAVLLALSLLGLLGQYPETYNAIIGYLRDVAPESVVDPLDAPCAARCRARERRRPRW